MKLGCINSCWFGSKVEYFEGITKLKEIGFDTIDIFPDFSFKSYDLKRIKKLCDAYEMPVYVMVSAYPELISLEEHVRRYAIESYKKLLDMGVYLDAKNLLIVLGEYIWEKNVIDPKIQWAQAVAAAKELSEYAAKCEMNVLVELEPFKYSLVNDIDTMEQFLADVDMPNCLANVDIGHLHVQGIAPKEILRLRGKIGGVHLSDNDGTVHNDWPPGRGNADIAGYLLAVKEAGYDDVVSIELEFAPYPDRIIEWVTEAYHATAKIMQDLNLRH
ncbi:sugar phosphate isomerase/epimerase [Brevibacillus sp. SYP-B805]|uniref:sugar phosphate isomerase/epimerase family protein n=1 Tax=Brevibacillus sp. SYP-B805 TaxID=1578199 RepID=UPI0013ECC72F|nr:sugar phosphate isomerase/epimerase [Brevibacillus sp. SYP-B805]NGQ95769.1 sugar phosphate isomerase/epimerase [Brevibacillus sp. SYP-B805]